LSVSNFYAQNIEFSWLVGDFAFGYDVINQKGLLDFNFLRFNWFEKETKIGINIALYQFVMGGMFQNSNSKDEKKLEQYNTLFQDSFEFTTLGTSLFPIEIMYAPVNFNDYLYLFFYGRASWEFWQSPSVAFKENPFVSTDNDFYGSIGTRLALFTPPMEKSHYTVTMGVFLEYTTKNEFKFGVYGDIIGGLFAAAQTISDNAQAQYEKEYPYGQ
jgi:hypothetical protein